MIHFSLGTTFLNKTTVQYGHRPFGTGLISDYDAIILPILDPNFVDTLGLSLRGAIL